MMVGTAVSTLTGQNIGACKLDRVKETFGWGLVLGGGMTLVVSIIALAIPGVLMHMFIKDPAVISVGVTYLRIMAMGYLFFAVFFVGNGVINGAGHTLVATIFSLVSLWIVRVPLAEILSSRMHRLEGIWYAMLISFVVSTCLSLGYYFSGRWKRSVVRIDADGEGGNVAGTLDESGIACLEASLD
jgi:Na+-driven multidrug efflux pump